MRIEYQLIRIEVELLKQYSMKWCYQIGKLENEY